MFSPFQKKKSYSDRLPEQDSGAQMSSKDMPEGPAVPEDLSDVREERTGSFTANKSLLDKKSLDLVFAVEQMIQAKQHVEAGNQELQDRLHHANGHIDRLNKDLKNLNKVVEDREKSILELEQRLIDKNLRVDQMMEDFRELQSAMSEEIEELKSLHEVERDQYAALLHKNNEMQAEKNKKISELEEKLNKLEIEHAHMKQKFEALREEKTYLVNVVNDFTTRMTSPFSSKAGARDQASPE
ncbi:hypothetical protein RAC89_11770 [Paenibacillus sp. GD4]|jgi:chromosome segregation ATPase|uniref:hypothetical protein n=1 Tax=Paenibacillus sp. GD4 TaxID=3068890 RepID=UPI0027965BB4|nr:hypothetical protein [Paenibacillus sp. GD4]MDQ1911130.1 hypothetical protein [Paenibacillus sp. GD4]